MILINKITIPSIFIDNSYSLHHLAVIAAPVHHPLMLQGYWKGFAEFIFFVFQLFAIFFVVDNFLLIQGSLFLIKFIHPYYYNSRSFLQSSRTVPVQPMMDCSHHRSGLAGQVCCPGDIGKVMLNFFFFSYLLFLCLQTTIF